MIEDEFFVPTMGLTASPYITSGDFTGSHHLLRYEWALKSIANLIPSGKILDAACGSGFGSYMIARQFPIAKVTGVDYDPKAINFAQKSFAAPNLQYQQGDLTLWQETIGSAIYDCIVSFDTIEHVSHREIAFENLVNHLHPDGSLLLSTPCGSPTNNLKPDWEYHKIEFSTASLYDFLKRYFKKVIAPDSSEFPNRGVFDQLNGSKVSYLLRLNPVICQIPITIDNPYRLTSE